MIYIIEITLIYILVIIAISESYKIDELKRENKMIGDRIEVTKEWYEFEMKMRIELARVDERYNISKEKYAKESEEFRKQCREFNEMIEGKSNE